MRHDVSRALPYSKIYRRPRRLPLAFVWLALAFVGLLVANLVSN
jgi:hypothetical protein